MLLAAEFDFFKKCSSVVHCQRVAIFSEIEFKCEKDSREDDDDMQDFHLRSAESIDGIRMTKGGENGRKLSEEEKTRKEQKEANATVKWARKK